MSRKPLTADAIRQKRIEELVNQRANIAQGVLLSMLRHETPAGGNGVKAFVSTAFEIAEEFINQLYAPAPEGDTANE